MIAVLVVLGALILAAGILYAVAVIKIGIGLVEGMEDKRDA